MLIEVASKCRRVKEIGFSQNYSKLFWYTRLGCVMVCVLAYIAESPGLYSWFRLKFFSGNVYIQCRLRVFVNRFLRRIFRPKRDHNGEWTRLHNEERNSFYRTPNINSIRLRWALYVAKIEDASCPFKLLTGDSNVAFIEF